MVYIYILFLIIALCAERKAKNKRFWRILIPLVYSALVGFRGIDVGIDTHTYYDSYYVGGAEGLGFIEPGFDWINTHLYKWGFNANFSFFVYALLTNFFFFLVLESIPQKRYTLSAFCLYFLTYTALINGIRQDLACAIFLYAFTYIKREKPLIYAGLLILGSLFHASVLIMLPFYFLKRINFTPKVYLFVYLISFIGVFADISAYVPSIELFNRDYGRYTDDIRMEDASWLGFFITNLINFITLLFIINTRLYKDQKELCLLSLFYFVFTNLGFHLPIISRVATFFWWFTYLLYAVIWENQRQYSSKGLYAIGVAMLILFNTLIIGNNVIKDNYQYYFYWENRPANFTHKYT